MLQKALGFVSLALCAALFAGCTGTTQNPTGMPLPNLPVPIGTSGQNTITLGLPGYTTLAANCAKGDQNSCGLMKSAQTICTSAAMVWQVQAACVAAGFTTASAGAP